MTGGADIIKCHVTVSLVIKYFLFAVDMNGINHTKMCRIVEQSYRSLLSVEVILPANCGPDGCDWKLVVGWLMVEMVATNAHFD